MLCFADEPNMAAGDGPGARPSEAAGSWRITGDLYGHLVKGTPVAAAEAVAALLDRAVSA